MSLSNANDVPGTDGRWYYGVTVRGPDEVTVTVIEKEGERRKIRWTMPGRPLQGEDIDPAALRRIRLREDFTQDEIQALLAELEAMTDDDYDEEKLIAEYKEWADANPEKAKALHERLERTINDAIARVRAKVAQNDA